MILVTHNPNIAVLGDAELIIPLKSTSVHSQIISSGSIDNDDTIKLCCGILEGGDSAFKQRKIFMVLSSNVCLSTQSSYRLRPSHIAQFVCVNFIVI